MLMQDSMAQQPLLCVLMLVLALAVAVNAQQHWRNLEETAPRSAAATAPKATGSVAAAVDRKPKRPRDGEFPTYPPVKDGKSKLKFAEVDSEPIVLPGNSSVVLFIGCSNFSYVPVSCGVITDLNGPTLRPAAITVGPGLTPAITPDFFIPAVYSCFLRYDTTIYGAAGAEFIVFNPNESEGDTITFRIQINCVGAETEKGDNGK
eukprot:jgi/Chrzof1/10418/UNPLg00344.t1